MELQDLVIFERVAKKGSLTRAATALNLAQPSVTNRVKSLEAELGRALFVRARRGVELTASGRTFLEYAERILTLVHESRQAVRAEPGAAGRVSVAAVPTISSYLLPKVVERLTAARPGTEVRIISGRSEQVLEWLSDGLAHIGFLPAGTPTPAFDLVPVYEDHIACVVPAKHPLLAQARPHLSEVARYPLVLYNWGPGYQEFRQQLREAVQCPVQSAIEADPAEMARNFVINEGRVSFLPFSSVVREVQQGRLFALQPADMPPLSISIAVAFSRRRKRSEAEQAFLDLLAEVCPVFKAADLPWRQPALSRTL